MSAGLTFPGIRVKDWDQLQQLPLLDDITERCVSCLTWNVAILHGVHIQAITTSKF